MTNPTGRFIYGVRECRSAADLHTALNELSDVRAIFQITAVSVDNDVVYTLVTRRPNPNHIPQRSTT